MKSDTKENENENTKDIKEPIEEQLDDNLNSKIINEKKELESKIALLEEQINNIKRQAANVINEEKIKNKITIERSQSNTVEMLKEIMRIYNEGYRVISILQKQSKNEPILMLIATLQDRLKGIIEKKQGKIINPPLKSPVNTKEHMVIDKEEQEGFEENTIVKVLSYGFLLKNRTIVAAEVIVAQ